jgi:DNA-binding transcriptional regulator YhcF (GntR family)
MAKDALRLAIKQYQDCRFWLYHRAMAALPIKLDRARRTSLAAQIYWAIREGIENGRLTSGARLPSWRDLAAQLGVSRGTVRVAYARLIAEQFAIGLGAAGTRVAERQSRSSMPDRSQEVPLMPDLFYEFGSAPLVFQMGVPSQEAFPFKLWSRILTRETRRTAAAPVTYPDPRGDPELRKGDRGLLGAGPRHSVQSLSGVRNRRILRCARSGGPRASAWKDGSLDRGPRLSAHSHCTRPSWHTYDSCPGRCGRTGCCRWYPDRR